MIYVIARQDAVHDVMELSGRSNIDVRNMMILGGSRIGIRIATELQDEINIKLVDYNAEKAYRLAETLDKTLIINEDGRNTEAMMEGRAFEHGRLRGRDGPQRDEHPGGDACQAHGREEGDRRGREPQLHQSGRVDRHRHDHQQEGWSRRRTFSVSPCLPTCRRSSASRAATPRCWSSSSSPTPPATKAPIKDLGLPEDAIIGGIVRGDKVFIAVDDTQISAYDRVVLFAMPASVGKVGYYFN